MEFGEYSMRDIYYTRGIGANSKRYQKFPEPHTM